jgi:integrase
MGLVGSAWTLETARAEARKLVGQVAAGVDPQADKAAAREEMTIAELCDLYLAEGMVTRKASSIASAKADIDNHIKPVMGTRRASLVTPADCDRMLLDIAEGKTARQPRKGKKRGVSRVRGGRGAANAAVTTLSAAFSFGIRRRVRPDNPARGVRKYPEKKIERFLSPAELARAGEALAAAEALGVESPYAIGALRVLMLSGCRKNEALTAKRAYVDAHNRCLRLPDSKTGAKVVHLGEAAIEVILGLPEVVGNAYLFPSRRGEGRLVDLQSPWERIRSAAGLNDVRIHDLRHAFASIGATGGDSLLIIGALLGHKSAKTTQRYAHLADHPLKEAANRISAQVAEQMGLKRQRKASARHAEVIAAPPAAQSLLGAVIETKWLGTPEAAEVLGSTVGTLQTWRWMGVGPRYRKIGRRVVYALGDLHAWMAAGSAAQPARAA